MRVGKMGNRRNRRNRRYCRGREGKLLTFLYSCLSRRRWRCHLSSKQLQAPKHIAMLLSRALARSSDSAKDLSHRAESDRRSRTWTRGCQFCKSRQQEQPCQPREPCAIAVKDRLVVVERHVHLQGCEGGAVAAYFTEDAAAIVRHGKESVLCRVRDRVTILDATHDGDVPVPGTVDVEVPGRIEQQPRG